VGAIEESVVSTATNTSVAFGVPTPNPVIFVSAIKYPLYINKFNFLIKENYRLPTKLCPHFLAKYCLLMAEWEEYLVDYRKKIFHI
jgi:hypothetical protein